MKTARLLVVGLFAGGLLTTMASAVDSTGQIPIIDMGPSDTFEGFGGGLYPNGLNYMVGRPLVDRVQAALRITPRNAAGQPATPGAGGRIVLLSIGMSNTSQESTAFAGLLNSFSDRNPALVFVNGAQGGQTAADISNPNANFWTVVNQRLQTLGVTPAQVQAVWFKEGNRNPTGPAAGEIATLRGQFETIMQIIRTRYPNTEVVYASSRIYGGYAVGTLNPEPYAYANGFAVKQLIEDQIAGGDAGLQPGPGGVVPLVQWSAYLWADGLSPRSDGLIWERADLEADGVHPAASGEMKVAQMLLASFSTDPSARMWFLHPERRQLIGDLNGDRTISVGDIGPFVLAITDPAAYAAAFPTIDVLQAADLNFDDNVTVGDIGGFVQLLVNW